MQWTVPQIQAEIAHLDAQMLSLCERIMMTNPADKKKVKILRNWIKAQTEIMTEILGELGEHHPGVHMNIIEEQSSAGLDPHADIIHRNQRFRPSDN